MSSAKKMNLTAITWAHAVNSQKQLDEAFMAKNDMIEADIVMGTINTTSPYQPIMAHPPATVSDLSLYSFLEQIEAYNNNDNNKQRKGIKLDFKSIDAFEASLEILEEKIPKINCPIWLNADIVTGPVNANDSVPVDPKRFFQGCSQFQNAVLSIGWTTKWISEVKEGQYTNEHIQAMLEAIKSNTITETGQEITFPVRAGIAANSIEELHKLVGQLNDTNKCTLTIWSSPHDYVDATKLKHLIFSFGLDRVYLDVPEDLLKKLNLGSTPSKDLNYNCKNVANSTMASLVNFGLMSAALFLLSLFVEKSQLKSFN